MRLLHTSDWHLGHTLRDWERAAEHAAFLAWLLSTLEEEQVDALLIAGDIFDVANPPASAQQAWYDFLAAARHRCPDLDIVVIGGNHDSPARLDAPNPLLEAIRVHMVGGMPADSARTAVPIRSRKGDRALVAAVPFLRPADLPELDASVGDVLIEGVRAVYLEALARLRAMREPGDALISMGHLFMAEGQVSETSERRILGGNQHGIPADLFPADVAYVALGHLHRAQHVKEARIAYSGSPLPLSMAEADYVHQVSLVDLRGPQVDSIRSVRIPRSVDMVRIPASGEASLPEVIRAIQALPSRDSLPEMRHPFVEVSVVLGQPEPTLQQQIQDAMRDRAGRLVKVSRVSTGTSLPLAQSASGRTLEALAPRDVFVLCHEREYREPPSAELLVAFDELMATSSEQPP